MKCWKKACNLGKNSFSLTPSRKANTPLKLTSEISCICCAVRFFANDDLTTTCNYVDQGVVNDVSFGSKCEELSLSKSRPLCPAKRTLLRASHHFADGPTWRDLPDHF